MIVDLRAKVVIQMKFFPYAIIGVIFMAGVLGIYVKNAYALERTININGVNYVSLTQMAKKYNLAIEEKNGEVVLTGEAVNLHISLNSNLFSLNGIDYVAQEAPKSKEDMTWITTKDWASMFNLSLTNYDKVSQMEPVYTKPVSTEAVLDKNTYQVGDEWGEKVPEGVRKHGNPIKIQTDHLEVPIYDSEHYNQEKQDSVQGH